MAGFITDFFGYSSEDASEKALEYAAKKRCPILGTSCSKLLARSNEPSGACAIRQITSSSPDVICCPIRLYSDEYKILRIVAERAFGTNLPLYAGRAAVEEARGKGGSIAVFGRGWGGELRLPQRSGKPSRVSFRPTRNNSFL